MNDDKYIAKMPQSVILEDRKKMNITGVEDVLSFDDTTVVMKTVLGELTVKGSGLKIGRFNVETGELGLEGNVVALGYTSERVQKGGFFGRVLK